MAVPGPFDLEGEDDEMTAGQAMEQADEMRPNNEFSDSLKQNWLRQCDSRLRGSVVERSETVDFDDVGADTAWAEGLAYDTELLAPEQFAPLYVHWLCAQMDLALGEVAREANEMQLYSDYVQEFAAWMRRRYAPAGGVQWRY